MSLLLAVLLTAPLELPENGAVRWSFETARHVQSLGCNGGFDYGDDNAAIFREVEIYISRIDRRLEDVQLATPDCSKQLPQAERLDGVSKDAGLATLAALVMPAGSDKPSRHEAELLSAAIAWHGGDGALDALRELSRLNEENQWKPAVFWLASLGSEGRAAVIEFLDTRHSVQHRKHALIVLALQGEGEALEPIRQSALGDSSADVRAEALFALALAEAPGAASFIETVARIDDSGAVRQRAIFALSQVGGDAAVDALIRIVRNTEFGEHRREALFWLAQMDQDRASELVARMASSL